MSFVLLSYLLAGCQLRDKEEYIKFVDIKSIEYDKNYNACKLIDNVDGYSQKDFTYEEDSKIRLPSDEIVQCDYSKKGITLGEIKYDFKYKGIIQFKHISVTDNTAPVFTRIKKEYTVLVNNEYFDLKNLIQVTDNYTSSVTLAFNGSYDIKVAGTYDMEAVATDQNDNKSIYKFKIIVKSNLKENEKEDYESDNSVKKDNNNIIDENNSNTQSSPSVPNIPKQESKPPVNIQKPSSQIFHIDNYDTFSDCENACLNYVKNTGWVGLSSCLIYKENDENKGYQAVFN